MVLLAEDLVKIYNFQLDVIRPSFNVGFTSFVRSGTEKRNFVVETASWVLLVLFCNCIFVSVVN